MHRLTGGLVAVALALCPQIATACAVCVGKSDSKMAEGMNAGIFVMLVVVGVVLLAFATFFAYLWRRSISAAHSQSQVTCSKS